MQIAKSSAVLLSKYALQYGAFFHLTENVTVIDRYQTVMHDFITQEIGGRGMTAIELMHDNYHYTKENTDCWYTFSKELEPALENTRCAIENKEVYIVSVEDTKDEQE